MLTEQQKYELVWQEVGRYGKDWTNPALASSIKKWIRATIPKKSSVMDFGCGNGTSLEWLKSEKYNPFGVEIAKNATGYPGVIIGDLRNDLVLPKCDYGMCVDVMEHIPTEGVEKVLNNISNSIRSGALFIIARDEDKDGAEVGQVLHLTRKPLEWWREKLLQHFSKVELLRYNANDESAICLWAWN